MEVSTSGFYEWLSRPLSATAQRREEVKLVIVKIFKDSDGTYGYRRLHAELGRLGVEASPEFVRGLVRELGLVVCKPRPWRHSLTESGQAGPIGHGIIVTYPGSPYGLPDIVSVEDVGELIGRRVQASIGAPSTRRVSTHVATLHGTSNPATIPSVSTRRSGTTPHQKSGNSTGTASWRHDGPLRRIRKT
ncbi:IS3 family transposase [Pseudactinotalea sp. HY160]|nr:IS3 family transposase [Pseudactinotalea sp. HY160]